MASNLAATARRKRENVKGVIVTSSKLSMDHFKSKMWNYYTKLGDTYVECKVCKKQFSFQNSTTGMKEHLLRMHSVHNFGVPQVKEHPELDFPEREGAAKRLKQTLPSNSMCPSISESQTQVIDNLLLEMICSDLHSLSVVEEKGFAKLVTYLEPNIELPTQTHLAGLLWHKYNVMKQQLKCSLQASPSVVLSTENWIDNSKRSYLSFTANVIDSNWRFCRYLLEIHPVHNSKADDELGEYLNSMLVEFGLSSNVVSCIVHDNPSMLSSYFRPFKDAYGWTSLCCTAHVLQGCIQAGLEVEEVKETLTAARDLVSYFQEDFKASCFLNSKLEAMNKPRLVLDEDSYWVSTLEMCQNLLDLKWAILSILEEHKVDNMSEQHWKLLQDLVPMLKTIWIATVFFQEEQNVSISSLMPCLFGIFNSIGHRCEANTSVIKAAAQQIRAEICRHWDVLDEGKLINNPAVVASFLDPRFKELRFLKPWARGELHMRVRNMLLEPCVANQQWSPVMVTEGSIDTLRPSDQDGIPTVGFESVYDLLLGRDPTVYLPEAHHQLENYMVEPVCKRTTHPLQWWNNNQQRYPALAKLARQYLAIPVTAVKPENAFRMLQDPLQSRKAALEPKHM
ncbi:E3 SUMO-protein ligase ZBED1-like, partial [Pyxicephalus adspersus]|uniref:E3 SUMO-protein ligase ZBED1-like n=1 Tax=Pyxicephalus adspersus TaxID=30357 RepID=UPI003B597724